jgi:hypothetical protein
VSWAAATRSRVQRFGWGSRFNFVSKQIAVSAMLSTWEPYEKNWSLLRLFKSLLHSLKGQYDSKVAVRYHEDWCTKNKRMFRISTCGLFLTCTANSFLFWTHIKKLVHICYLLEQNTLLGKAIPFSWYKFPTLWGPLLVVNCPCAPCISLTSHTSFPNTEHLLLYTKTTLTSPVLLSETVAMEEDGLPWPQL